MGLTQKDIDQVIEFVKKEPRTVQEVSRLIGRSWVTTETYLQKIKEQTGLLSIKGFREGTRGALKIVYYAHKESLLTDDIRGRTYNRIQTARRKQDFDFFEVFQFVPDEKKKAFYEEYENKLISTTQHIVPLLKSAERVIYLFSGNLSFIHIKEDGVEVMDLLEGLLKSKVMIKILCRVNIASLTNITKISHLLEKYSGLIEIRNCYQPLRGFIIDESVARFTDEESLQDYKSGELHSNIRIFYEIYDKDWIAWLQRVFWGLYRTSIDYRARVEQLNKFM